MPKKRKPQTDRDAVDISGKLPGAESPAQPQPAVAGDDCSQPPAATTAPVADANDSEPGAGTERKQWSNPIWVMFACPAKGFNLVENRRFKQFAFYFDADPGAEVKGMLKETGFIYRPGDQSWTLPVTAANHELAVYLARELKGEELDKGR